MPIRVMIGNMRSGCRTPVHTAGWDGAKRQPRSLSYGPGAVSVLAVVWEGKRRATRGRYGRTKPGSRHKL
ncbi:MAG: hypothetical protein M1404_00250 [Acidobacteria bacterium]|nr:hypothetical protein [Acidobacteriota bacterium]